MKAAVVHGFDRPLVVENVPVPTAGPEQVLVRIEACGLCHIAQVLDGSAPGPRMVFRMSEVPSAGTARASVPATA